MGRKLRGELRPSILCWRRPETPLSLSLSWSGGRIGGGTWILCIHPITVSSAMVPLMYWTWDGLLFEAFLVQMFRDGVDRTVEVGVRSPGRYLLAARRIGVICLCGKLSGWRILETLTQAVRTILDKVSGLITVVTRSRFRCFAKEKTEDVLCIQRRGWDVHCSLG